MLTTLLSLTLVLSLTLGLAGSARADEEESSVTGGETNPSFSDTPSMNSGFVPPATNESPERADMTLLDSNKVIAPNSDLDSIQNSQSAPENQQD